MSEYAVQLWRNHPHDTHVPKVDVDALTEFEAAALALDRFRQMGEEFGPKTGVEILQGNVTHSAPVAVADIMKWLRHGPEGQALVEKDGLHALLDFVPDDR